MENIPVTHSLKQRKLIQWAIAYLAGGWVLLQVLDLVGDKFGWPDSVGRIAIVILAVGFLAVLVLAWFHGEKGQQRVSAIELGMLAGILVLAGAAVFMVREQGATGGVETKARSTGATNRRALAVLPFKSLSADPDNEYFASGIHDELLTQLSKLGDLRVISRTSLQARLTDTEKASLASRPTENAKAYDLYLRAYDFHRRPTFLDENFRIAEQLYHQAIALDPKFALAYARLSQLHGWMHWLNRDPTRERREKQRAAAERALALQPGLAEAHLAMGYTYYWGARDYERALAEFAIALKSVPNDAELRMAMASVHRRQGKFDQAIAETHSAQELDPRNGFYSQQLGDTYRLLRKYPEAIKAYDYALAIAPDDIAAAEGKAMTYIIGQGNLDSLRALASRSRGEEGNVPLAFILATLSGDQAAALEAAQGAPEISSGYSEWAPRPLLVAWAKRWQGDPAGARAAFEAARVVSEKALRRNPDDPRIHIAHGYALAGLGRKEEAQAAGKRAVDLMPSSRDAMLAMYYDEDQATILAQTGAADRAVPEIQRLLAGPSDLSIHMLARDPIWDPIRHDLRFQALLRQGANR